MAIEEAFVVSLSLLIGGMICWAFKRLPEERWQFLASVPVMKDSSGRWHGLNFTYYGLLTANAVVFGVAILIVLLSAIGVSVNVTIGLIAAVLPICLPAARWVPRLVEGKQCSFTVAGAFFVGILTTPAIIHCVNTFLLQPASPIVPMIPAMAALMVAYAFGEGLGRLACISFGCCYGVSLRDAPAPLRWLFARRHFVFRGAMKKISYASGMEGKEVVPIQAITCILYIITGLTATLLFLRGHFEIAYVGTLAVTQGWRAISETLRADYRGAGKISAYQGMSVLAMVVAGALVYLVPDSDAVAPDLAGGIASLWQAELVISLQALWVTVFLIFGKSMVTGAQISFHLRQDRI